MIRLFQGSCGRIRCTDTKYVLVSRKIGRLSPLNDKEYSVSVSGKTIIRNFTISSTASNLSLILESNESHNVQDKNAMEEASKILENFGGFTYNEFLQYIKNHIESNKLASHNMKFLFRALIFQEPSWAERFYSDFERNINESHLAKYELYLNYELKNFIKIEDEILPRYLKSLSDNNETMNAVTLNKILVAIISNQKNIGQIPGFIKKLINDNKVIVYSMIPTKVIQLLIKNHFQTKVIEDVFSAFTKNNKFPISNNLIILLLEYYAKITKDVTQTSFYKIYYEKLTELDKRIYYVYSLIHAKFENQTNLLIHKENNPLKVNQILNENTISLYKSIQEILINLNTKNSESDMESINKTKSLFLTKLLSLLAHKSYYRDMIKIMKILKLENLLNQNKIKVNDSISFYFTITEQFPGLLKYITTTTTNNKDEFKNISKSTIRHLILSFKKTYPELIHQYIECITRPSLGSVVLKNKEFFDWVLSVLNKSEELESSNNHNTNDTVSDFISKGLNPSRRKFFHSYRKALLTNNLLAAEKTMALYKDCNLNLSPAFKIFELKYQLHQYLLKCATLEKLQLFEIDHQTNSIISKSNYNIVFQNSSIKYFNDKTKEDCEYIMKKMIQNFIKNNFEHLTFNSFIELGYIASGLKLNDYSNKLLITCDSIITDHSNHEANGKDPILRNMNIMINRSEIDKCYLGLLNNYKFLKNYDGFNNVLGKILNNHEYKLTAGLISKISTQFKHFMKLERSEILKRCNVEINVYSHNSFDNDNKSHETVPIINSLVPLEKFSEILDSKYKNEILIVKRETEHYKNILMFAKEFERLFINIKLRFGDQSMFFESYINQSIEFMNDWYEYSTQRKFQRK